MGILDLFRRRAEALPAPQAAVQGASGGRLITSPAELETYLRDGEGGSAAGEPVTPTTAMRVAAVYGCVRIIAGAVATLPLEIKRRVDDRTRQTESGHPLSLVLRRKPNGWMKPAQFRRMMQAHILLRGNAYARVVRGTRGVQALLPLHPDRVTVRQLPSLELEYDYRRPDGATVTFRQEDVLHITGLTLDGVNGVSVLTYARETVGMAIATAKHGATFFRNGTQLGSVLKHPKQLGDVGQKTLRESLEAFRGAENAHKTLILEEGMEWSALGMTSVDAQFVETLKLSRSEIGMFFGVPPHMLGDTEKSTSWGSGIEQQSLGFVAYTLEDWLTAWEESVDGLFTPAEADHYSRFNRAALVKGDIKARWDSYTKGLQWGVWSPNEVRALEDENPRPDGDIYYPPPNTAGGGSESDTKGNGDDDPEAA